MRVLAGVAVGERRQQQGARVRGHVQPVRHKSDRAEQKAAADLQRHHRAAKPDDRPTPPLGAVVAFAQIHVAVT